MINERAYVPPLAAQAHGPKRRLPRRRAARSVAAALPLLAFALSINSPVRASNTDTAEHDYKSGKFDDAVQNYQQATQKQPDRNDLVFDLGDANYKAGKFDDAEDDFKKSLHTPDLGLQENAYFNLGNAQFKHGEALQKVDTQKTIDLWEKALHSYDSSLKLKTSADAKRNYDIVKQKLEELKKQQQQQQQQNNKSGSSQPDDKSQSGKDSKGNDGKNPDKQQSQPGNDQNNGQNPQSQQQPQPGQKPGQDKQPGSPDQDKNGQQQQQSSADAKDKSDLKTYSGVRTQDKVDPGVKSREEAEALLDSLKDDEHHITARVLNGNNDQPPPPPSGKDW